MPQNIQIPEWIQYINYTINFISLIFTIISSFIVAYLFFFQKKSVISIIKIVRNYSQQLTLSELRGKLNNLQNFPIDSKGSNQTAVLNLLSEILGQLNGNPILKVECHALVKRLENIIKEPKQITESQKRIIGHELSEVIRHLDTDNYKDLLNSGSKNG